MAEKAKDTGGQSFFAYSAAGDAARKKTIDEMTGDEPVPQPEPEEPEQKKRAGGKIKARGVGIAKRGHGRAWK